MQLAFAGCVFDSGTRQVTGRGGGVVPISPKAFQLLEALILARPKAVSKEDLHALLWPKTFVEDANLPNLVAELRAQLGDSSKNPQIIRTVQRFGYAFVAAEEQPAHEARETPGLGENRGSAAGTAPVVDAMPRTSKFPRRAVFVGTILVALAVAAALLSSRNFSFLSRGTGIPFKARDWVLVSRFENRTGQPLLDGTLEYALRRELSNSRYVNVVPRERIDDALRLMRKPLETPVDAATGQEICLRDGDIRVLVTGRIERLGSKYRLSVELVDPNQGASIASAGEDAAGEDQLLPSTNRISDKVRALLGEKPPSIREGRERLVKVTTPSLRALQLYSRADAVIGGKNDAVAEELLRQAVAEDPEFASAYVHLAWAIRNQGKPKAEYIPPAETAFRLSDRTTDRERYFIRGSYYDLLRDDEKAITAYQALLFLYPDHEWGLWNLANVYAREGRLKDASEMVARLSDLRPKGFESNAVLAAYLAPLDPARSRMYARRARRLATSPSVEEAPALAARLELMPAKEYWLEDDVEGSLRAADGVAAKIDSLGDRARGAFADQLFPVYLELGRLDSAARCLQKIPDPLLRHELLSRVAFAKDDPDALKEELEASEEGGGSRFPNMRLCLLARAGLLTEAGSLLTRLEDRGSENREVQIFRGEMALARGQVDEAISQLEEGTGHSFERALPYFSLPDFFVGFVGSESLTRALTKKGERVRAIKLLERASALRRLAAFEEAGQYWLRIRYQLAQLYRESGRVNEARAIEDELRKLLALGDSDHPIRRALERLRGS